MDLQERVMNEAELRGVSRLDTHNLVYQALDKIKQKYGGSLDLSYRVYHGSLSSAAMHDELKRRDELVFRYVRRYMTNGNDRN